MEPTRTSPARRTLRIALGMSFLSACEVGPHPTDSDVAALPANARRAGGDFPVKFVVSRVEPNGNCGTQIWLVRPSDGTMQQLSTYNCSGAATGSANVTPKWSPDGQRITWARLGPSDMLNVWIMNADGSGAGIVPGTTSDGPQPSWSPDGYQILFADRLVRNTDIWKTDALTCDATGCPATTTVQLTDDPAYDQAPAWSPDGRAIAFASSRDGGGIFLMRADGSRVRQLTSNASNPVGLPGDSDPSWSPDGRWIAFTRYVPGDPYFNAAIFVMRRDGRRLLRLTTDPANDRQPVWSADGSQILFLSNRDGPSAIYAMNRDGSAPQRVLAMDRGISSFDASWTP
jgi:Tol biopolymer transport system component